MNKNIALFFFFFVPLVFRFDDDKFEIVLNVKTPSIEETSLLSDRI